ncbi:hypothetical protein MRX96_035372 [Rhipicephalus microplus]
MCIKVARTSLVLRSVPCPTSARDVRALNRPTPAARGKRPSSGGRVKCLLWDRAHRPPSPSRDTFGLRATRRECRIRNCLRRELR